MPDPNYVLEAWDEYRLAQNALTDAIQAKIYPTKVAQNVYRFGLGCMGLGRMRAALDEGNAAIARQEAENARDDFIMVQNRLEALTR